MSKTGVKNRNLTLSSYLYIAYLILIKPPDVAGTHQSTYGYPPDNLTRIKPLFSNSRTMASTLLIIALIHLTTIINGKLTTDEVEYIKTQSKNVETKFRAISHKNFFQHRGIITGVKQGGMQLHHRLREESVPDWVDVIPKTRS